MLTIAFSVGILNRKTTFPTESISVLRWRRVEGGGRIS